jgi:hypothetical protein
MVQKRALFLAVLTDWIEQQAQSAFANSGNRSRRKAAAALPHSKLLLLWALIAESGFDRKISESANKKAAENLPRLESSALLPR